MKKILILIATALIAHPSQISASGSYGEPILQWKHAPAQSFGDLTSEIFQFFLDEDGKEVRHGLAWQFDSAGNLIAHARYLNGQAWEGSVARIYLSCGIAASRSHFADGKVTRGEILEGKPLFDPGSFGFIVKPGQILEVAALDPELVEVPKLVRR